MTTPAETAASSSLVSTRTPSDVCWDAGEFISCRSIVIAPCENAEPSWLRHIEQWNMQVAAAVAFPTRSDVLWDQWPRTKSPDRNDQGAFWRSMSRWRTYEQSETRGRWCLPPLPELKTRAASCAKADFSVGARGRL